MDMAITAMATVKSRSRNSITKIAVILSLVCLPSTTLAGDWEFKPSLSLDETYSDNIERSVSEPKSSNITQAIAALRATYKSSAANLNLSGTKRYSIYSHNSQLNADYRSLSANGSYNTWTGGPTLIARANIANVSKNNADNSLADPISGDTVETQNYATGLNYNFGNSSYSVISSLIYSTNRTEDGIGESDGYRANLTSKSGNNASQLYWQVGGNYSKRTQELDNNIDSYGENYSINALIGTMTPWDLRPFVRFYDEKVKGTSVAEDRPSNASWGAGVRWLPSPRLTVDLSYNETANDNHVAASVNWQPSSRTSLAADYSQRFFGKSYNFKFTHKTRRLINNINYQESLNVFDRNNYQEGDSGDLELVESNAYFLNRNLAWSSKLNLSRTSFSFNISTNEQENLETNIVNDTVNIGLTVTRKTGVRTNMSLGTNFRNSIYDKKNPEGSRQEDYYRTIFARYSLQFASSLSSNFTLKHVNRSSTNDQFGYKEIRATINIKKDF